jgi:hypothetical protein
MRNPDAREECKRACDAERDLLLYKCTELPPRSLSEKNPFEPEPEPEPEPVSRARFLAGIARADREHGLGLGLGLVVCSFFRQAPRDRGACVDRVRSYICPNCLRTCDRRDCPVDEDPAACLDDECTTSSESAG